MKTHARPYAARAAGPRARARSSSSEAGAWGSRRSSTAGRSHRASRSRTRVRTRPARRRTRARVEGRGAGGLAGGRTPGAGAARPARPCQRSSNPTRRRSSSPPTTSGTGTPSSRTCSGGRRRQPHDPLGRQHAPEEHEVTHLRVHGLDRVAAHREAFPGRPRPVDVADLDDPPGGVEAPQVQPVRDGVRLLVPDPQGLPQDPARRHHVEAGQDDRVDVLQDRSDQRVERGAGLRVEPRGRRVHALVLAEVEEQVVEDQVLRPDGDRTARRELLEQAQVAHARQQRVLLLPPPALLHQRRAVGPAAVDVAGLWPPGPGPVARPRPGSGW